MKKYLVYLLVLFSVPVWAQEQINTLAARREVLASQIESTQKSLTEQPKDSEVGQLLYQKLDVLKQVDLNIGQQIILDKQAETSNNSIAELKKQADEISVSGIGKEPPYTFFYWDKINDDLSAINNEIAQNKDVEDNLKKQIELAQKQFEEKETQRRKIKEANSGKSENELTLPEDIKLTIAEYDSQLAQDWLTLKKKELANNQLRQNELIAKKEVIDQKLKKISGKVLFSEADLNERLDRIEKLESDFAEQMEVARKNLVEHDEQSLKVQGALGSESLALLTLKRSVLEKKYELNSAKLRRSPIIRELWLRRYQIFNNQFTRSALRDWKRDSQDYLSVLDREYEALAGDLSETRKKITTNQNISGGSATEIEQKQWLEKLSDVLEESMASIETSRKLHRKLVAEINRELKETNFRILITDGYDLVKGFLNIEVLSVEDRPITIGKIILALFLLIIAFSVSRRLSQLAGRKILNRFHINEGPRQAIETLVYYSLLIVMILFALYVANVPLTLFTVVGGALAIGVGFGSQNIINNFISSLIMMVEQPIRIGDVIDVEGNSGRVVKIGARCTHLRTFSNVDILVPNSSFLEKNVVNWTLTDDKIRVFITVGVSYDSDSAIVEKLLYDIVCEHDLVLKEPEPLVLFTNFGESTLDFKVEYWVRLNGTDRREIESELRHKICMVFKQNNIVMAFPQRDLHIGNPVSVKISHEH